MTSTIPQPSRATTTASRRPSSCPTRSPFGGYLNLPGQGSAGALDEEGDPRDVYSLTLIGNETILLAIADAGSDIDLFLYDAEGKLIDGSVSPGNQTESLRVLESGDYFIELVPMDGASNYVLTVGQEQNVGAGTLRLSSDFVPGEILVTVDSSAKELAVPGLRTRRRGARGLRLMSLADPARALTFLQQRSDPAARIARHIPEKLQRRLSTLLTAKALGQTKRNNSRGTKPDSLRQPGAERHFLR